MTPKQILLGLLPEERFVQAPVNMIQEFGWQGTSIIKFLIIKEDYLNKFNKNTEKGWIKTTKSEIEEWTGLTIRQQETTIKNLKKKYEDCPIITTQIKGVPATLSYKINFGSLTKILYPNSITSHESQFSHNVRTRSHIMSELTIYNNTLNDIKKNSKKKNSNSSNKPPRAYVIFFNKLPTKFQDSNKIKDLLQKWVEHIIELCQGYSTNSIKAFIASKEMQSCTVPEFEDALKTSLEHGWRSICFSNGNNKTPSNVHHTDDPHKYDNLPTTVIENYSSGYKRKRGE